MKSPPIYDGLFSSSCSFYFLKASHHTILTDDFKVGFDKAVQVCLQILSDKPKQLDPQQAPRLDASELAWFDKACEEDVILALKSYLLAKIQVGPDSS
jgi:hypothetical protein